MVLGTLLLHNAVSRCIKFLELISFTAILNLYCHTESSIHQHTFYNLVNPNQVNLYRQPPNIPNDVWEKATRGNPDPTW
jgi:hypothetical protein